MKRIALITAAILIGFVGIVLMRPGPEPVAVGPSRAPQSQASASPWLPCNAGPEVVSHIIGGEFATPGSKPWIARIELVELENELTRITSLCTGSAISETAILTAAHCVPEEYQRAEIQVGGTVIADQVSNASAATCHAGFSLRHMVQGDLGDDLAILRIAPHGQPVLPLATEPVEVGEILIATGWGTTLHDEYGRPERNAARLRELEVRVTEAGYRHIRVVDAADAGQSPCVGDSGGPLLRMTPEGPEIVGVLSNVLPSVEGNLCGTATYTAVQSYAWAINEAIALPSSNEAVGQRK